MLRDLIDQAEALGFLPHHTERVKRLIQSAYWIGANDCNQIHAGDAERRAVPRCSRAGRHADIPEGYACIECEFEPHV